MDMVLRPGDRGLKAPWYLAWGDLAQEDLAAFSGTIWKDSQFAVFQPISNSSATSFVLSLSERFVIAGEV